VKRHTSHLLLDWRIWLSMNPDRDGTAIWLEKKFDVPSSGQWESEYVFSIPLSVGPSSSTSATPSPGIIIFECTPLEGVTDELERWNHFALKLPLPV
jgi:nuclear mRNA export protein SAC3